MSGRQPTAGPSRIKHHQPTSSQAPPPPSPLSAFNPSRTHYALAQPVLGAADKVTVWDVASDRIACEWDVEQAGKVSTLCWASVASGSRKQGKRRRKSGANNEDADDVVLIATKSSPHLVVYSPRQSQVVRKLNLSSAVTAIWSDENGTVATTSTSVLVCSPDVTSISHTFKLPANTPSSSAITILSSSTPETLHVLIGSMSVVALHLELASSSITHTSSPLPVSTSSVTSLTPLPITSQGASFLAVSEDDRTVSQYTIPTPTKAPKLSYRYASPTLSPAHSVALSSTHLSVLHQSGEVSLFSLPTELDFARPKSDSKPSSLKLVEGKAEQISRLSRVEFAPVAEGESAALLCGRMLGAGRVKWHKAVYELPEGGLRPSTVIKCEAQDLVNKANGFSSTVQRFSAPTEVPEMPDADIDEPSAAALPNDVDMADLSLGERLLALPNGDSSLPNGDASGKSKTSAAAALDGTVNAASLTRLLVQALHTSDPALLTLCLSHRDSVLIRNTIRKMPAQMALPLLKACVERLGQGKGANRRGGGRGSAQSEQHARGTVEWVKGVLVERGSILMTMPSLPLHLANLSQLLQTRLQLYQPLLSLSGRLDLALAQIQLRQQAALHAEGGERKGAEGRHYVEGESDDDDDDSDDDVAIEVGDGDGEIEDIDMRDIGSDLDEEDDSDDDDEDEVDEEESDDEDEEDDDDPLDSGSEQGYLDLEAEEDGSDEEEDSEEE